MRRSMVRAFTLVELIIVIIIIGILAAIAIPQFIGSSADAKKSTVQADVAVLRNGINLYYHQHNQIYPGAKKVDGSGTDTAAGDNPVAFVDQMTKYTDATGKTSAAIDRANFPYGPYVMNGIPINPITNSATVVVVDKAGVIDAADIPTGTNGWIVSKQTGEIRSASTATLTY